MRHKGRGGVSTYLEVFLLIGVAVGGSAIVMSAASRFLGPLGGAGVAVEEAAIRQGADAAFETLVVVNTGGSAFSSFVVSTAQSPGGATFCYALSDPSGGAPITSTCPAMQAGPGSFQVDYPLKPGAGVEVELLMAGGAFSVGSEHLVTVTASTGSQESVGALVVAA
ncbi:MAG: hypothetical protein JRM71_04505 [Nitrososphaerota archaeon]|nr:hypothetical protein [Nitrososphaerota archaeon]